MKEPVSKGSDVRRFSLNVFLRGCSSLRSINLFFYIPGIKIKRYNSHSGSGARVGEEYFIRPCFNNDRLSIYCEISKILKCKGIGTCPEANIFKQLSKSLIQGGVHFSWGQERIALPPSTGKSSLFLAWNLLPRAHSISRACLLFGDGSHHQWARISWPYLSCKYGELFCNFKLYGESRSTNLYKTPNTHCIVSGGDEELNQVLYRKDPPRG